MGAVASRRGGGRPTSICGRGETYESSRSRGVTFPRAGLGAFARSLGAPPGTAPSPAGPTAASGDSLRPVVAGGSLLERTALRQFRDGMLTFRGHTKPLPHLREGAVSSWRSPQLALEDRLKRRFFAGGGGGFEVGIGSIKNPAAAPLQEVFRYLLPRRPCDHEPQPQRDVLSAIRCVPPSGRSGETSPPRPAPANRGRPEGASLLVEHSGGPVIRDAEDDSCRSSGRFPSEKSPRGACTPS